MDSISSDVLIQDIEKLLSCPIVNVQQLKQFSQFGYPMKLRGLCWKILLGYLPQQTQEWDEVHANNAQIYRSFIDEYFKSSLDEYQIKTLIALEKLEESEDIKVEKWKIVSKVHPNEKEYQANYKLWEQIEKDTVRTRSELNFFQQQISDQEIPILFLTIITKDRYLSKQLQFTHMDALTRILYIYGRLNSGIKYVQGMNELLSNIYYVFYHGERKETAESDAFFCFVTLMSQTHDNFIRILDNASGIKFKINRMEHLLKQVDEELWIHLTKYKIEPYFFGYRWILLYLSHEFPFEQILQIWDSIIAHENHGQYVIVLCVQILISLRDKILQSDFNNTLMLLQNFEIPSIRALIQNANSLWALINS